MIDILIRASVSGIFLNEVAKMTIAETINKAVNLPNIIVGYRIEV
jgi:hypothetical protein